MEPLLKKLRWMAVTAESIDLDSGQVLGTELYVLDEEGGAVGVWNDDLKAELLRFFGGGADA